MNASERAREVIDFLGTAGGLFALLLGLILSLRALGVFEKPRFTVRGGYLPKKTVLGFDAVPHFVLELENIGNVPVTFGNFELILPRSQVVTDSGFVGSLGAEFLIDKKRASTVGAIQHIAKLDYRTEKITVEPGKFDTRYFDLEAFVPDGYGAGVLEATALPNFEPILRFDDSFRQQYWCDRRGLHVGVWRHPEHEPMKEAGYGMGEKRQITLTRSTITRRWKKREETAPALPD